MRRLAAALLTGLLFLSSYGCNHAPSGATSPSPGAVPPHAPNPVSPDAPSPSKPALPTPEQIVDFLAAKGKIFGPLDDPKLPATEWIGLDENNHLVVTGQTTDDTLRWMKDPDVTRLIIIHPHLDHSDGTYTYSQLTQETFSKWPAGPGGSLPFPAGEWPRRVDLYAEAPSAGVDLAAYAAAVATWMRERLGARLVDVKPVTGNESVIKAVVKGDGLSEEQRMLETATLYAGLSWATGAGYLEVTYQGVTRARVIGGSDNQLSDWALQGADPKLLPNCLYIDDVRGEGCPVPPYTDWRQNLIQLFAKRPQLQALLPKGGRLIIADAAYLRLAIDGDVAAGQSWEQAWTTYAPVIDKLFTQAPVFEIELTLHRGNEVEYMLFDASTWSMRHFALQSNIALEPASLTINANFYRRYTQKNP